MKKAGFLFIFVLGYIHLTFAKNEAIPDTVKFVIDDHSSIELIVENIHDKTAFGNLNNTIDIFMGDLNKIKEDIDFDNQSNAFTFDLSGQNRVLKYDLHSGAKDYIILDQGGKSFHRQKVKVIFNSKNSMIIRSRDYNGLKKISEMDVDKLLNQADPLISEKKGQQRHHKVATVMMRNGEIDKENSVFNSTGHESIELGLDIGLGNVRNEIVPDFGLYLLISRAKKGKKQFTAGLDYENLFFFQYDEEGNQEIRIDGFLSGVFTKDDFGIKLGGLVNERSDSFYNGAYKVGFMYLTRLNFETGFYLNDNFKQYFPYLRISKAF